MLLPALLIGGPIFVSLVLDVVLIAYIPAEHMGGENDWTYVNFGVWIAAGLAVIVGLIVMAAARGWTRPVAGRVGPAVAATVLGPGFVILVFGMLGMGQLGSLGSEWPPPAVMVVAGMATLLPWACLWWLVLESRSTLTRLVVSAGVPVVGGAVIAVLGFL